MKSYLYLWHMTFPVLTIPVNIFASDCDSSRYATYKTVNQIQDFAEETVKRLEPRVQLADREHCQNSCVYLQRRTKQGFYLVSGSYPSELWTPWGVVNLYNGGYCDDDARLFNKFSDHLELKFVRNTGEVCRDAVFYRDGSEISPIELDSLRGSAARIQSYSCAHLSIYKITKIKGSPLPEPELVDFATYEQKITVFNSAYVCIDEWNRFKRIYSQEKAAKKAAWQKLVKTGSLGMPSYP